MRNIDPLLIQAYTEFNSEERYSTEDITCDPVHRRRFLEQLWVMDSEIMEAEALRRLTFLRKQKKLPAFSRRRIR